LVGSEREIEKIMMLLFFHSPFEKKKIFICNCSISNKKKKIRALSQKKEIEIVCFVRLIRQVELDASI